MLWFSTVPKGAAPRCQQVIGLAGVELLSFETMDEERLIVKVQNHRITYDVSHPFYKDNM